MKRQLANENGKELPGERFSPQVELALYAKGWKPGGWSEEEASRFEFPLHNLARKFICEFSEVDMGEEFWFSAENSNLEYRNFGEIAKIGFKNCIPVAVCWTWGEGSVWMDEEGSVYLGGSEEFFLLANSPDEAIELFLFPKQLPENVVSWRVGWIPPPWQ